MISILNPTHPTQKPSSEAHPCTGPEAAGDDVEAAAKEESPSKEAADEVPEKSADTADEGKGEAAEADAGDEKDKDEGKED